MNNLGTIAKQTHPTTRQQKNGPSSLLMSRWRDALTNIPEADETIKPSAKIVSTKAGAKNRRSISG
jgi:hypothetical protein